MALLSRTRSCCFPVTSSAPVSTWFSRTMIVTFSFGITSRVKAGRHSSLRTDPASLATLSTRLQVMLTLPRLAQTTSAATIIGTVVKLTGDATAVRNGVVVALNIGDKVYKGDVVQSGSDSALGISFIDGTAFSLGASARMVLNDMVYDPNGSSNSSLLSLVQGTISFVAGETAKNGNMKIDTPVATMGIRGTAVVVEMTANNGPVKFSVVVEPGGHSGSAVLLDKLNGFGNRHGQQAGPVYDCLVDRHQSAAQYS